MELDSLSLEELRNLRTRVDQAISSFEKRKRDEALAAAEEAARAHGFKLSDLSGVRRKGQSRTASAPSDRSFAHPDNPAQTWSGRGRRPGWVKEALEAGRSLEDMAV